MKQLQWLMGINLSGKYENSFKAPKCTYTSNIAETRKHFYTVNSTNITEALA
jgi:hypothetical protein